MQIMVLDYSVMLINVIGVVCCLSYFNYMIKYVLSVILYYLDEYSYVVAMSVSIQLCLRYNLLLKSVVLWRKWVYHGFFGGGGDISVDCELDLKQ